MFRIVYDVDIEDLIKEEKVVSSWIVNEVCRVLPWTYTFHIASTVFWQQGTLIGLDLLFYILNLREEKGNQIDVWANEEGNNIPDGVLSIVYGIV